MPTTPGARTHRVAPRTNRVHPRAGGAPTARFLRPTVSAVGRESYTSKARAEGLAAEFGALQQLRQGTGLADPSRLADLPESLRTALGMEQLNPLSMSDAVANFAQAIVAMSPSDRAIAVLTWNLGYSSFDLPGGIDPPIDAQWTDRCEWAIANDFLPWTDTGTVRHQSDRVVFRLTTSLVPNGHNAGSDGTPTLSEGPATLRSMHAARHQIVSDLVQSISDGSAEDICLVGGGLRSMSDIIREFLRALQNRPSVDNPTRRLAVYVLDPHYTAQNILPGRLEPAEQLDRNAAYASLTTAIERELTVAARRVLAPWNVAVNFFYYQGPPFFYCYLIGRSTLYWGPFTWSPDESDWAGATNACMRHVAADDQFDVLRSWFLNRIGLFEAEAALDRSQSSAS